MPEDTAWCKCVASALICLCSSVCDTWCRAARLVQLAQLEKLRSSAARRKVGKIPLSKTGSIFSLLNDERGAVVERQCTCPLRVSHQTVTLVLFVCVWCVDGWGVGRRTILSNSRATVCGVLFAQPGIKRFLPPPTRRHPGTRGEALATRSALCHRYVALCDLAQDGSECSGCTSTPVDYG